MTSATSSNPNNHDSAPCCCIAHVMVWQRGVGNIRLGSVERQTLQFPSRSGIVRAGPIETEGVRGSQTALVHPARDHDLQPFEHDLQIGGRPERSNLRFPLPMERLDRLRAR